MLKYYGLKHYGYVAFFFIVTVFFSVEAQAYSDKEIRTADRYYQERSYHMAAREFAPFLQRTAAREELAREVSFKWSDSILRGRDERQREAAEKKLQELIGGKDKDRWRAEAQAALAEHYISRDPWGQQQKIHAYLEEAREYWAGSTDLKTARRKFIDTGFLLADYMTQHRGWHNPPIRPMRLEGGRVAVPKPGQNGLTILYEEILKIAESEKDKARAAYGYAMAVRHSGSGEEHIKRTVAAFEKFIKDHPRSEWADDAFYQLGLFYEGLSRFPEAVTAYRGLLETFRPGESPHLRDASRRVEQITAPHLSVGVGSAFVPGSQIGFQLNWRNLKAAEFTLYKIDMADVLGERGLDLRNVTHYQGLMRELVEQTGRYRNLPVHLRWTAELEDDGKHRHYNKNQGLAEWRGKEAKENAAETGVLPPGAYLLTVAGGGRLVYELVLVSDLSVISKMAQDKALFWVTEARTGKPVAGADIRFVYSWHSPQRGTQWEVAHGRTGTDGLYAAELKNARDQHGHISGSATLFAAVSAAGDRQAFVQNNSHGHYRGHQHGKGDWWSYAFADRPAYRPDEEIGFKGIVRLPYAGGFSLPRERTVKAEIYDARGNKVYEQQHSINDFGGFDGTLTLDEKAVLGEYTLRLHDVRSNRMLSSQPLFRLEEYKLPEFLVSVAPKTEDGKEALFRLGDKVEMEVDAQYYFGGAVSNAQVTYLVYQRDYHHSYTPPKPYPWYYRDKRHDYMYGRRGMPHYHHHVSERLVTQANAVTDDKGRASFTIETPEDSANDLEYRIEVRVVDQSRREITASETVKVTKNSFFAYLEPERNLYRPGDTVRVKIKTMTANGTPVSVEGKVAVAQRHWVAPTPELRGTEGGYADTASFQKFTKTDAKGEVVFTFEPSANGYYGVTFTGFDNGREVSTTAHVFVSDKRATDIGYRYSGLQIITEKDTYNAGETLRAMIVAERPDTWVLLTQESDGIFGYEMLYLEGPVRMVEIPVTQHFMPNVFVQAVSVDQFQLKTVTEEIIVPPEEQFLNVKIISDKQVYQPQEDGVFDILVTDRDGKPVAAEVSLGLVDSAVYYIQQEYAPDIREFFYGDKRPHGVQTRTAFQQRQFVHLVRDKNGNLVPYGHERRAAEDSRTGKRDDGIRQQLGQHGGGAVVGDSVRMELAEGAPMAARSATADMGMAMDEMAASPPMMKSREAPSVVSGEDGAEPRVRDDFRSTVIWQPSVKTGADGKARVKVTFPDSLTTWRMTARTVTQTTRVGNVTHEVQSNKPLMVRLQAPRFFTERDRVTVSALIDNLTEEAVTVTPRIAVEGLVVDGLIIRSRSVLQDGQKINGTEMPVTVPAGGQTRVEWAVTARQAGEAVITVSAGQGTMADAMRRSYTVIPHGIEKFIAEAAVLKNGGGQQMRFTVPAERIKDSTGLQITLSPSLAANMLDALPYLAEFPYGCVEQTMSRFLPAVIVRSTLRETGISEKDVQDYINNVLTPRGDPEHPQRRTESTVSQLDSMVDAGLARIYDMQNANGGWGWWKESRPDRFMSAYVVWGLALAREAGIDVRADVLMRGVAYLQRELVQEQDNPDNLAWMLHALAYAGSDSVFDTRMRDRLWEMRDRLNPYTRALFALSEQRRGHAERSRILGENLANGVLEDREHGTARWGESGIHYRWSEGGVEATAFVIKALSNIAQDSDYLEPAVKWLTLNRRGGRWKNTRDTAIAILALSDYLKTSGELAADYGYKVTLNGRTIREGRVDRDNIFTFDRIIDIPADAVSDGENIVAVEMTGRGALYVSGYLTYFTLEEPITKAGNEIYVDRKYYIQSVKETLMQGYKEDWKKLEDGDTVKSGDRIRVDVVMEAKNHYEYLISEDYKPAGFESTVLTSGAGQALVLDEDGRETGRTIPLYQEFRDRHAAFFIDKMPQGTYLIRYELRAEVPGVFHAMPNQSHAMYVPEIRANSDEMRLTVED